MAVSVSCRYPLAARDGDMGPTVSDAELLEASLRGERAAFGTLVERYQSLVAAVSYSRTRDSSLSEDVAQETFLAAWRQLDQLREPRRLGAWLCGIARNVARKARRKSGRELPSDTPQAVARDNPFEAVAEAEAERVVGEALGRVPDTYRDVLVLYYREQRPARDIAELLGLSEAAVMQRLTRGRQYLADGVHALVETSLRKTSRRSRRDLAAAVVASLPPMGPRVAPSPHGGTMIVKVALAAAAFTALGTTAYVVHSRSGSSPVAPVAAAADPAAAHGSARSAAIPRLPAARGGGPVIARGGAAGGAHPAAEPEPIERATIERLKLDRGPTRGPADAPVTITMFTDMQCPYCERTEGTLDQLFDEYPNKLRLVMKQMPVHKTAQLAAEAALAADAQGKFWEMHEQMLAHNEDLSHDALLALGQAAGLDVGRLRDALDRHSYAGAVADDMNAAAEIDFRGTPSFLINGRRVMGAMPVEEFHKVIDAALAETH
jgi:RNA polymerase sigma factor (sigma-70 family)